jgi:hypothetical protein
MDRGEIRKYFGDSQWETAIRNAPKQRLVYKGALLEKIIFF